MVTGFHAVRKVIFKYECSRDLSGRDEISARRCDVFSVLNVSFGADSLRVLC